MHTFKTSAKVFWLILKQKPPFIYYNAPNKLWKHWHFYFLKSFLLFCDLCQQAKFGHLSSVVFKVNILTPLLRFIVLCPFMNWENFLYFFKMRKNIKINYNFGNGAKFWFGLRNPKILFIFIYFTMCSYHKLYQLSTFDTICWRWQVDGGPFKALTDFHCYMANNKAFGWIQSFVSIIIIISPCSDSYGF